MPFLSCIFRSKDEQRSVDSFICGFRLAWEMANELNHYEANRHPLSAEEAETDACSML